MVVLLMDFASKCVKGKCKETFANADRTPIFQNNSHKAGSEDFYYRYGSVNSKELASQLAYMYDRPSLPCHITSSGMSAITIMIEVLYKQRLETDKYWAKQDKYKIILADDLYEETKEYFKYIDSSLEILQICFLKSDLSPHPVIVRIYLDQCFVVFFP